MMQRDAAASIANRVQLIRMGDAVIVQQALCAAAKLGVADLLDGRPQTSKDLADRLQVNEPALYRILRLLASEGIFEETLPRVFNNSGLSNYLRSDVPGSLRSFLVFRGSQLCSAPIGEMLHSVRTGQPSSDRIYGVNVFEQLKADPEMASTFDDAMTALTQSIAPAVAGAYDFGAWGSVTDVGGGNGLLLSTIMKTHPGVRGVLADLPHVLERARDRGFLGGELQMRSQLQPCDMFGEIPSGSRAYVMKSVIHDWDDERARQILSNCRRAIPDDGVLLLVELALADANLPSLGKVRDVLMMVLTGGMERTVEEYRRLLADSGFRLNQVYPVPGDYCIIESFPI